MIGILIKFPVGYACSKTFDFMLLKRQKCLNQFGPESIAQNLVRLEIFKGILQPECNGFKGPGFGAVDILRCGFARIDFLLERGTQRFFLNEVNTLPGFTPISMFPKLWEASGLSYPKLIEKLVEMALERSARVSARQTRREG